MPRVVLGLVIAALLATVVWLSGDGITPAAPQVTPPAWEKVHDGGQFIVYRASTTPAAYLIAVAGKGVLIDCPVGLPAPPATVERILLTHHHRDGCGGVRTFGEVPVSAPTEAATWLEPKKVETFWDESIPLRDSRTGYFVDPSGHHRVACDLTDGRVIDFHGLKIEVIATPGHSPDHVCFAVGDLIFLGDAMTGDGKLWTPFTTDWDHWQDVGLKPTAESLRKLAARHPATLFPARGPIVTANPKALLEDTAKKVDEAGFLKSFERFTNRLGNPPRYDYLVPENQPKSNGSQPWAKVSPSLWLTGNTYVLKSNRSNGLTVVDPWGTRSVEQIEKLRAAEKLGPVERVVFSHAHYDHFDGVYTLPVKGDYKVWALDLVAQPLEAPFRYRAPFLDERPIHVHRTFQDGESGTWQEYEFKFHHFPGQSYFTAAMEGTIDGKRGLFTADNFFHQNMYSGSGGWMGMNRSSPALYAASARKVLAIHPEWVLAEHGGPFVYHPEDFRRRVAWGEAGAKACDALCVTGDHRLDWSPHSVSVSPILLKAKPGDDVRCELTVAGFPHAMDVAFRTDWDGEKTFHFDARPNSSGGKAVVKLTVPVNARPGRVVIPVTARGPLGEVADPFLAVDVTR
jgi:glyoxylase-like metal-dependent hydrolase (beta-lactamase superfamily II)